MALCKLERRNYGRKWPVSIKYQNLHSFKEGLILLCQSILETRRITHLHGWAHFTIPLRFFDNPLWKYIFLKEFLACSGCFGLFSKIKKGSRASFWCTFCTLFFHKNVPYLILYESTKFQCHTLFLSQYIK